MKTHCNYQKTSRTPSPDLRSDPMTI
uniref:Uncharacterized protein n=1 Tax=Anguilla anguilla TaxID=7936 RepID=A0A0E9QV28_ANGAN